MKTDTELFNLIIQQDYVEALEKEKELQNKKKDEEKIQLEQLKKDEDYARTCHDEEIAYRMQNVYSQPKPVEEKKPVVNNPYRNFDLSQFVRSSLFNTITNSSSKKPEGSGSNQYFNKLEKELSKSMNEIDVEIKSKNEKTKTINFK